MNSLKDLEQRDQNQQTIDKSSDAEEQVPQEITVKNEESTRDGADLGEQQLMLHNNQSAEEEVDEEFVIDKKTTIIESEQDVVACDNKENNKNRKVSFPIDNEIVTGYLEPVNPWEGGTSTFKIKLNI